MDGISVIICTHNGKDRIGAVLLAIAGQANLDIPWEVIVIDNASTDGTADAARRAWNHPTCELKIVREDFPGLCVARETGFKVSRYEMICGVDDDNILSPTYLQQAIRLYRMYPHAAVFGGLGLPPEGLAFPDWWPKNSGSLAIGPQGEEEGPVSNDRQFVYGAGSCFRRTALDELNSFGFTPILSSRRGWMHPVAEDLERCYALRFLGWQIVQSRQMIFVHQIPPDRLSWDYCSKLYFVQGEASAILNLYFMFLEQGLKYSFKRTAFGVWATLLLNKIYALLYRLFPLTEPSPAHLERLAVLGRERQLCQFKKERLLFKYYYEIRDLYRRCTPTRLGRGESS